MPKTYKTKVCSTCGKAEGKHWARHWKLRHPSEEINELLPGEDPSHPYDENWVYLIKDQKVKKLFKNGYKEILQQETFSE
jgi:predicted alpha/beta hydrolase family esterase